MPSPELKSLGDFYAGKTGLSANEAGRSKLFWNEFVKAVGVATVREITHQAVGVYQAKIKAMVFLDTNNNGKLDAGELSFTTGSNGAYSFVVAAGTFHVREVLKCGFKLTAPVGGTYRITLASGKTVTGKNFGDK